MSSDRSLHLKLNPAEMEQLQRLREALKARMARAGVKGEVTYKSTILQALAELEGRVGDWERKR